jgi:nickel transport protein
MTADNRIKSDSSGMRLTELEAVIESVLDRKLRPIVKMLSDSYHSGPSVRDIAGGIGYLLGLVGVAMYFQSRKK